MTQTEALKLALEALEPLIVERTCEAMDAGEKAIIAIKEALAQPEQEPATKEQIREAMIFNLPLYTMPPHPDQEPLAWMYEFYADMGHKGLAFEEQRSAYNTPLYITPPQRTWVGLTDEELELLNSCGDTDSYKFAKSIEAKLKQKNGYAEEKNT